MRDGPDRRRPLGHAGHGLRGQRVHARRRATPTARRRRSRTQHGRWWYRLALLAQRDGDIDAALQDFDRAIALSPDFVPARWRRGLLLLDRGDLDGAEAAFKVAATSPPTTRRRPPGWPACCSPATRPADAAARLEALIARAPTDRYAYQLLGTAYRQLGRSAEAQEALAAGAGGEPAWTDPWSDEVGVAAARLRVVAEGRHGTGDGRTLSRGHRAAGTAPRRAAGRSRAADLPRRRLCERRPRRRGARRLLDAALADDARRLRRDDAPGDGASLRRGLRRCRPGGRAGAGAAPGSADATRLRGVIAWRAGRLDDARRLAGDGGRRRSARRQGAGWVGTIAREQRRPAEALDAFRRSLARDPLLVDALVGGALAGLDAGATADAARWLARAKRIAPGRCPPRRARAARHGGRAHVSAALAVRDPGRRAGRRRPAAAARRPPTDTVAGRASPPWFADEAAARGLTSAVIDRDTRAAPTGCPRSWAAARRSSTWTATATSTRCWCRAACSAGPDTGPRHRALPQRRHRPVRGRHRRQRRGRRPATAWAWPPATTTATATPTST